MADLVEVHVLLTPSAAQAMQETAQTTVQNRTTVICLALLVYRQLIGMAVDGGDDAIGLDLLGDGQDWDITVRRRA